MPDPDVPSQPALAAAARRHGRGLSWIWLIPLLAAIAGVSLVMRAWMEAGPVITISFQTAEGLEAGKTQLRFKDVVVGTVQSIRLAEDRSKVFAKVDMAKEAASLAQTGTSFWVVRPRLGISGVSGLGTLVTGAYIAVDAPVNVSNTHVLNPEKKTEFVGLEVPPEITSGRPGKRFTLRTGTLGSLDIGSPVYYRRINVGQVTGYQMNDDGRQVNVEVFIDAPNDRFVTPDSRFWNASGIDFTVNAQGLTLRTQSLLAVAIGGIAFEGVAGADQLPASAGTSFILYADEPSAKATPDGDPLPIRIRFDQSLRGLAVGAPIDFNGVTLGTVESITMDLDTQTNRFFSVVRSTLYPERLGKVYEVIRQYAGEDPLQPSGLLLKSLIGRGLRAQLRTANLLTGQLYIAMDVFNNVPPVEFTMALPASIPSIPGNLDRLQEQFTSIVNAIEKVPFDKIGGDLRLTLASASALMRRLDRQVAPEAQAMLRQGTRSLAVITSLLASDSALPVSTERALAELSRAARALRGLSEYLQANPEALIRGRNPDPVSVPQ